MYNSLRREKRNYRSRTLLVGEKGGIFIRFVDIASTLMARDYKGWGNYFNNAVIEVEDAE